MTFNLLKKNNPRSSFLRIIQESDCGIYNVVRSISFNTNAHIKELLETSPFINMMDSVLTKLINLTESFKYFITHNSRIAKIEIDAIERKIKRNEHFGILPFYIDTLKLKIPPFPVGIIKHADMISTLRSYLKIFDNTRLVRKIKENRLKKDNDGRENRWISHFDTPKSLSDYLYEESPVSIEKGVYTTNEITPVLSQCMKDLSSYYKIFLDQVTGLKSQLDKLKGDTLSVHDDLILYSKLYGKDNAKLIEIELNSAIKRIDEVYFLLIRYHKAGMLFYARAFTVMTTNIHEIYNVLDENSKQRSIIDYKSLDALVNEFNT